MWTPSRIIPAISNTPVLISIVLPSLATIVKKVETKLINLSQKANKFITLRQEMMGIMLPESEGFLFESILPRMTGRSTGIECFYKNTPEQDKLARNIKSTHAAWLYGYLLRKYTSNCVQRLISCFDPEEAALAHLSCFITQQCMLCLNLLRILTLLI